MSRLGIACFLAAWLGASLLASQLRWFRPSRLAERLGPYLPAGHPMRSEPGPRPGRGRASSAAPPQGSGVAGPGAVSLGSLAAVVVPLARDLGDRVAKLTGVSEDPAARLERIHSADDVAAFRARQLGFAVLALAGAALVCLWWRPPPALALLLLAAAPVGAFARLEHRLSRASAAWQRQLTAELPVVSEQLGMLLRSGWSLGGALERLSSSNRGSGRCASDLARVCDRIRQGLGVHAALEEWAEVSGVEPVRRLVAVLRLEREAGDVGRLVSEEARLARAEAHRRLVEVAERRAQQVWVPVTVAALVPGVIFLAVPFTAALEAFGGA